MDMGITYMPTIILSAEIASKYWMIQALASHTHILIHLKRLPHTETEMSLNPTLTQDVSIYQCKYSGHSPNVGHSS